MLITKTPIDFCRIYVNNYLIERVREYKYTTIYENNDISQGVRIRIE